MHLLATRFGHVTPSSPRCWSQQSRISAPNSSCVITLRPHVMNLVVETDSLVDGQRQRPKSLQKEAFDSFDNKLLPTSQIMRAAREKIMQTSQRPRVLHHGQLTVPMFALASAARWAFSVTASASCELETESFVASSFSAPKLSLDWKQNSTPAPTASGLRREWTVAIRSTGQFHACVCGPKFLVNNIWSLVQTHIFVPCS